MPCWPAERSYDVYNFSPDLVHTLTFEPSLISRTLVARPTNVAFVLLYFRFLQNLSSLLDSPNILAHDPEAGKFWLSASG